MKVDFHCHTKATKKGEPNSRNVDPKKFVESVIAASVEIVAITNHNDFDLNQYKAFIKESKGAFQIWPGVELDVSFDDGTKGHLIVIAHPDQSELFYDAIKQLIGSATPDTAVVDIDSLYQETEKLNVIFIIHYGGKSDSWPPEATEALENKLAGKGEAYRLFKEPGNLRSLRIFAAFNENVIIGSDVSDWNHYAESNFSELRLRINDFEKLIMLAKKDKPAIDDLKSQKKRYHVDIKIQEDAISLSFFKDINIIFGHKGTGKSVIIEQVCEHFKKILAVSRFIGSQREPDFQKRLDVQDEEYDTSKMGVSECREEIKAIAEWKDTNPERVSNYVDAKMSADKNANKKLMGITEATLVGTGSLRKFEILLNQHNRIIDSLDVFNEVDLESILSNDERRHLFKLVHKVEKALRQSVRNEWILQKAKDIAQFSIRTIKKSADQRTDSISKPTNTGFYDFAKNRLNLRRMSRIVFENMNRPPFRDKILLGELDKHGYIFLTTIYEMFDKLPRGKRNFNYRRVERLNDFRKTIEQISSSFNSSEVSEYTSKIADLASPQNEIDSLRRLLSVRRCLCKEDGTEYNPSSGEIAILLLQECLSSEAEVYILDEPELSLGNKYINKHIVPKLSSLSKTNKTVIVATHNANIAVRTLPYMSIYREHDQGKYSTYVGDPFSDQLIGVEDPGSKKSWTEESMHTLEGGVAAFADRRYIYGA